MKLFEQLRDEAAAAGLDYLLIGGHAVIAHGFARNTADIDLLISADQHAAWRAWLVQRGYRMFVDQFAFMQLHAPPGELPLDVMIVDAPVFAKMKALSVRRVAETVELPVVGAVHLIALKLHTMRQNPRRGGRDWLDIDALVRVCKLDVDDPELRAIVEKHGGTDAYRRLRRGY